MKRRSTSRSISRPPDAWCSETARARSGALIIPSLKRICESPSSSVWLRASAATMRPLRKEMATMSCWPWTVRMPVLRCWETSCRISGSLKRSRVPSTAMAELPAETHSEVDREAYGREGPGQDVAGIVPPGDADAEPADQRQHQQGGEHQQGEEGFPPLADLGRGDAGEQGAPPALEGPFREHLGRPLRGAEGAPREVQDDGDQEQGESEEHPLPLAQDLLRPGERLAV